VNVSSRSLKTVYAYNLHCRLYEKCRVSSMLIDDSCRRKSWKMNTFRNQNIEGSFFRVLLTQAHIAADATKTVELSRRVSSFVANWGRGRSMMSRHAKDNIYVLGEGGRYELLRFLLFLLFRLFKIPADCRRFNSQRPTFACEG